MTDFVFIDGKNRPFFCTTIDNKTWLCRWHRKEKRWVTLKPVERQKVDIFFESKISDAEAQFYHDLSRR